MNRSTATVRGNARDLFVKLLRVEDGHVDSLESQVHQIQEMGYERYLINQAEE